jgi:hypothetical protein
MLSSYVVFMLTAENQSELIAQALGVLAWILGLVAAAQRNDATLKALYGFNCFVLGAFVGAGTVLATAVRNITSIFCRARYLSLIFIGGYLAIGYFNYERPVDILSCVAACVSTIAFFHTSGIRLRALMLLACSVWLAHNFIVGSIGATLLELGNVSLFSWRIYKMRASRG